MTTSDPEKPAGAPAGDEPTRDRGQAIATMGAVISAIVASSCCWLPLVLLALGISGTAAALVVETYRPLFITATFGVLAVAFYLAYRPRRPARALPHDISVGDAARPGEACCDAGPSQISAQRRSFDIMSFNKVLLWAVTLLAVTFIFFPRYAEALLGTPVPCCARGGG